MKLCSLRPPYRELGWGFAHNLIASSQKGALLMAGYCVREAITNKQGYRVPTGFQDKQASLGSPVIILQEGHPLLGWLLYKGTLNQRKGRAPLGYLS